MGSKIIVILLLSLGSVGVSQAEVALDLQPPFIPIFGDFGDPKYFPVEEDPGADPEVIDEVVHDKVLRFTDYKIKLKWTSLGYGQHTEKVIIPELAAHTLFNHRNRGEEGPCLRSFRFPGTKPLQHTGDLEIEIVISNQYLINRDRGICKVNMTETVSTEIQGVPFTHTYSKPMGFRYIGDCPGES